MATKNGGYAFPQAMAQAASGDMWASGDMGEGGMMLRDWFAGQALAGYMTTPEVDALSGQPDFRLHVAQRCYAFADAMLAAREKGGAK